MDSRQAIEGLAADSWVAAGIGDWEFLTKGSKVGMKVTEGGFVGCAQLGFLTKGSKRGMKVRKGGFVRKALLLLSDFSLVERSEIPGIGNP